MPQVFVTDPQFPIKQLKLNFCLDIPSVYSLIYSLAHKLRQS